MRSLQFTRFIYKKQLESTNESAMIALSNKGPSHNFCLYTYDQTAGRGQIGRKWYSGSGENLTATYTWQEVGLPAKEQFRINMAFALAIYQLIHAQLEPSMAETVSIKWPNDIYIGDRKVAGILIRNVLKGDRIATCLMGVGINVNAPSFPPDLPNPVSLFQLSQQSTSLMALQLELAELLSRFLDDCFSYPQRQRALYIELLYRRNSVAAYEAEGERFQGEILGVTEVGKLRMRVGEQERQYSFREVQHVIG